jgi:hypothetical protein
MKLITKKNISFALAMLMATCILTSAKADPNKNPVERKAVFVHSAELDELVDEYFEELEMNSLLIEEETVKLFDHNDNIIFEGLQANMDEEMAQRFNQAEYLSEMGSTSYYKILH